MFVYMIKIAEQLEKSQGKVEATKDSIVKITRNLEPVEVFSYIS